MHPLSICAGTDSLLKIGEPQGAGMRMNTTLEDLWTEQVSSHPHLPKYPIEDSVPKGLPNFEKYTEDKVDKMREKKDKELEDYRREKEPVKKSKLLQRPAAQGR